MKFTNRIKNFLDAPIASEEFGLDSWKNYEVKFTQWMEAFSTKFNNDLSIFDLFEALEDLNPQDSTNESINDDDNDILQ